jgi:hypothetical protein
MAVRPLVGRNHRGDYGRARRDRAFVGADVGQLGAVADEHGAGAPDEPGAGAPDEPGAVIGDEDQGDAVSLDITPPDPDKGIYIFASGRKGSGKSVVCRSWFDCYPYDRVVIDVTHDLRADFRRDGVEFDELRDGDLLPARLPASKHGQPDYKQRTWIYCPDAGAATAVDDMDRVAGLAIGRGPTLIWFDEYGTVTTGNKTPPNVRRILHHGRHDKLTALFACPRPMDIDGLAINQADRVYTFATANPDDRDRIAKNIGFDPKEFSEINASLPRRGKYWHTMFDQTTDQLWIMPPLPTRRRGRQPIADPDDAAASYRMIV